MSHAYDWDNSPKFEKGKHIFKLGDNQGAGLRDKIQKIQSVIRLFLGWRK
jgi:hypothetical protein